MALNLRGMLKDQQKLVNKRIFKSKGNNLKINPICYANCLYFTETKLFRHKTPYTNFTGNFNYLLKILRKEHSYSYIPNKKYVYKPKPQKKVLSHQSLISLLQKCNSVQKQIEVFHSTTKLSNEDIHCRRSICEQVENTLKPYFPSCVIDLLGSSINGLGLKGCDVDLSLQFSNANVEPSSDIISLKSDVISLTSDAISSESVQNLVNEIFKLTPRLQLLSIRKILQTLNYEEPLTVIPGRCPILNFNLQDLSCDLSINNRYALQGTNLMLLCNKLDHRVVPLTQIINYWAKHSRLVGGPGKLKSYALFLMVVYFLQTRTPPVLPSIESMFEKTDFIKNLENWSYDVTEYLWKFESSKNSQNVEELLREFFFFYGNFDFSYIICPLNVTSVDRKSFALKIDCINKFILTTISIQDPINPEWNVTTEVNWKYCKSLLRMLLLLCEKYQNKDYLIHGPRDWGLAYLININNGGYLKEVKEFDIYMPLALSPVTSVDTKDILEAAINNVKYILNHCLLFQCEILNSHTSLSSLDLPLNIKTLIKNENLHQFFDSVVEKYPELTENPKDSSYLISYLICSIKDTWSGRNTFSLIVNDSKDVFFKEHEISKKMDVRGKNEKDTLYFSCECYHANIENKVGLHMKLKPLNSDKFSSKLAMFLKEYIPRLMKEDFSSLKKGQ